MNLTEGELIEQIDQVDEGWWSGVAHAFAIIDEWMMWLGRSQLCRAR
ncbi:uncharacterized protein FIBRA_08936 [Fibroporia radiculosa]|uniref:SH3 domain-containing protein n=1 Tax=Fibroporia radiculosa TaxID=599839 RepID=J4GIJ5_9APHY|nr:uncharacterized protein FIBRA_08936 [Fibroporia radiculosa]CCM06653.1 predicted protein [Fibroporia radiculosa]